MNGPDPTFDDDREELHHDLHSRWTCWVGEPGYDKAEWLALDRRLWDTTTSIHLLALRESIGALDMEMSRRREGP